jgi:hypothetical protein
MLDPTAATTMSGQYAPAVDRRSTTPAFASRSQHFIAMSDSLVMCGFTPDLAG